MDRHNQSEHKDCNKEDLEMSKRDFGVDGDLYVKKNVYVNDDIYVKGRMYFPSSDGFLPVSIAGAVLFKGECPVIAGSTASFFVPAGTTDPQLVLNFDSTFIECNLGKSLNFILVQSNRASTFRGIFTLACPFLGEAGDQSLRQVTYTGSAPYSISVGFVATPKGALVTVGAPQLFLAPLLNTPAPLVPTNPFV